MTKPSNTKPVLEGLISEISVDATFFEANQTYLDSSIFEYSSPIATDAEKDKIEIVTKG